MAFQMNDKGNEKECSHATVYTGLGIMKYKREKKQDRGKERPTQRDEVRK